MNKSAFVFSEDLLQYKFNDTHPFNPKRLALAVDLLQSCNMLAQDDFVSPGKATDKDLALIHDPSYIDIVKSLSHSKADLQKAQAYGLGTEDTPIFEGMHDAALGVVGATLTCVDLIMNQQVDHALNLSGGLHHGLRNRGSGFCVYNDVSIAIKKLIETYKQRVLYIDTDAHHGDGVQWTFYDNPDVCKYSIHETGRYLFPGTGEVEERGSGKGYGYTFNLPVDAFTEDDSWLEIFEKSVNEVAAFFKPDIIVSQHGVDAHVFDPLTHLCLSMKSYKKMPEIIHQLAHQYANGKWIALGGGGYDIYRVVPRAWSMLWMEMTGQTLTNKNLPTAYINKWQASCADHFPSEWLDPVDSYPAIPRREDITNKNLGVLRRLLQPIYKVM